MKRIMQIIALLFLCSDAYCNNDNDEDPNKIVAEMMMDIQRCTYDYSKLIARNEKELHRISGLLAVWGTPELKLELLLEKDRLKDEIEKLKLENASDISRIR